MTNAYYEIGLVDPVVSHFPAHRLVFRDTEIGANSDDSDMVLHTSRIEKLPELERIVAELIRVNRTYKVVPKN
jgi:hypothetical protein